MPQARSLSCVCARRACVHARGPSWCGAHAYLGEVYAFVLGNCFTGALLRVSVSVSPFSLSLSVSRRSPSSIADFLTLSLKASLCLSPSVRLSSRLSSSPVPPLSPFFLRSSFSRAGPRPLSPRPLPCPPPRQLSLVRTLSFFLCLLQADLWSAQGLSLAKR